jgi:hypothetical protein
MDTPEFAYDLSTRERATSYWQAGMKAGNFATDGPSTALTMAYASYHLCEDGNHAHTRHLLDEAGRHLHGTVLLSRVLDIAAPRGCGAHVAAVATGLANSQELHDAGADAVLDNLADINTLVTTILSLGN